MVKEPFTRNNKATHGGCGAGRTGRGKVASAAGFDPVPAHKRNTMSFITSSKKTGKGSRHRPQKKNLSLKIYLKEEEEKKNQAAART